MRKRRPVGITVIGAVLTFIGGFSSLVIFIEMIDSMATYGFFSVMITSPAALIGFLIYGLIPIIFYSTGIGLFTSRPWARQSLIFIIPALVMIFGFHMACNAAKRHSGMYHAMAIELLFSNFPLFLNMFFRLSLLLLPSIIYANRPNIVNFFK
jgi:hypothetical protein